jgi:hypothetical protein
MHEDLKRDPIWNFVSTIIAAILATFSVISAILLASQDFRFMVIVAFVVSVILVSPVVVYSFKKKQDTKQISALLKSIPPRAKITFPTEKARERRRLELATELRPLRIKVILVITGALVLLLSVLGLIAYMRIYNIIIELVVIGIVLIFGFTYAVFLGRIIGLYREKEEMLRWIDMLPEINRYIENNKSSDEE